jgi:PAS domain S-box-containing protein
MAPRRLPRARDGGKSRIIACERQQSSPARLHAVRQRPGKFQASMSAFLPPRRAAWRLRSYFVGLALLLLLPSLGLGGAVAWRAIAAYRDAYEQRLQDTARALALATDREIGTFTTMLEGLAVARLLDEAATPEDLATFRDRAAQVAAALDTWVVVRGPPPDYAVQVHTALPFGDGGPGGLRMPPEDAPLPRVFATGQPAIGGVAVGRLGRPTAFVFVPVLRDGRVVRAIGMAIAPERLTARLAAHGFSGTSFVALVDARGRVAARSRDQDDFVGQQAPGWYMAATAGRAAGFLLGPSLEGPQVALGFARLDSAPGWNLALMEPLSAYTDSWRRPLATLLLGGALVVALGLAGATWLARSLLRPVRALAADAAAVAAMGRGGTPALTTPPSMVLEFESLRRDLGAAHAALRQRAEDAQKREQRLRLALDAAQLGSWEVDLRSGVTQRAGRVVPEQPGVPLSGYMLEQYFDHLVHPEDVPRLRAVLAEVAAGERAQYRIEYRVRPTRDGGWTWMESYGGAVERDATTGQVTRMAGVSRDVSARRAADDQQRLLMREVDHRAKNVLAVVQSVLRLTRSDDPRAFAAAVEGRVLALARAHELLARDNWHGAGLAEVIGQELLPFRSAGHPDRIRIDGPQVTLAAEAVQPLELVVHELTTNAAKYGALSVPDGQLAVTWWLGEPARLHLCWEERGGPPPAGAPVRSGFGSRLVATTLRVQLGGAITLHWKPTGLVAELTLNATRLLAQGGTAAHAR